MSSALPLARFAADVALVEDEFAAAVLLGLFRPRKTLPCRYFYDARGSELFEEITRLPEYYPTRTETQILAQNASEITAHIRSGDVLVEFGSGSSLKTEILLDRVPKNVAYVPIDVSEHALQEAKSRLRKRYPALDIRPIVANFANDVAFPSDLARRRKTGFFPGSTIGNLAPPEARDLLSSFARLLSDESSLLIGVDLKKDARTLVAAYNDAAGVTAEFNLNLLERINRELGATINVRAFCHEAIYDPRQGRIEMHLVSTRAQNIEVLGHRFHFRRGETIHTENSYKYTVEEFRALAEASGWRPASLWTDANDHFSVHALTRD